MPAGLERRSLQPARSRSAPSSAATRSEPGTVDAVLRPGQGFQSLGGDRLAAADARPKPAVVDARQGRLHESQLVLGTTPQGEVALLLEHVRGGGGLGAVGHLAWGFNRDRQLVAQTGSLLK